MTQYTLKLSFDLRQITQSLAYEFVLKDKSIYAMKHVGPLAGTFNFQKGDEICVEVVATSAAEPDNPKVTAKDILKSFEVNNCTFVSIPASMTEDLSLFDDGSACTSLDDKNAWGPIVPTQEADNVLTLSRTSTTPLNVETKNGQWKISGYLSVELNPAAGAPFTQLYFFDPEGSTGNGGGFGP